MNSSTILVIWKLSKTMTTLLILLQEHPVLLLIQTSASFADGPSKMSALVTENGDGTWLVSNVQIVHGNLVQTLKMRIGMSKTSEYTAAAVQPGFQVRSVDLSV